jgi:hypothetical protein
MRERARGRLTYCAAGTSSPRAGCHVVMVGLPPPTLPFCDAATSLGRTFTFGTKTSGAHWNDASTSTCALLLRLPSPGGHPSGDTGKGDRIDRC